MQCNLTFRKTNNSLHSPPAHRHTLGMHRVLANVLQDIALPCLFSVKKQWTLEDLRSLWFCSSLPLSISARCLRAITNTLGHCMESCLRTANSYEEQNREKGGGGERMRGKEEKGENALISNSFHCLLKLTH